MFGARLEFVALAGGDRHKAIFNFIWSLYSLRDCPFNPMPGQGNVSSSHAHVTLAPNLMNHLFTTTTVVPHTLERDHQGYWKMAGERDPDFYWDTVTFKVGPIHVLSQQEPWCKRDAVDAG